MSYGDDLMTTGMARRLKTRFPDRKILIGDGQREYASPIFLNNPNIDHLGFIRPGDPVLWIHDFPGHRPYINYTQSTPDRFVFLPYRPLKGDLFFTEREIQFVKKAMGKLRSFVVIEPTVGTFCGANKDWGFDRWQAVVDRLRDKKTFVQFGKKEKQTLKGVTRIATEDFRTACAILSFAKLFIGPEGALHHAAAALDIPGVVIFGGRISPETTGYSIHANLYVDLPGSPCGRISPCAHCRECMARISVPKVLQAVENQLHQGTRKPYRLKITSRRIPCEASR